MSLVFDFRRKYTRGTYRGGSYYCKWKWRDKERVWIIARFAFSTSIRHRYDVLYPVNFRELVDLQLTSWHRSRHGRIVKFPETYESVLWMKGEEKIVRQLWLSQGRPSLGPQAVPC